MTLRLEPLDDHLEAAARLLAARHAEHHSREPLLPLLPDPAAAVQAALEQQEATGLAAVRDGEVVAYLIQRVAENDIWGRHAWVDEAGHASGDPEALRALYAALAPAAVDLGALLHLALVPAVPDLLDPWLRLSFGYRQVLALRESGAPAPVLPEGALIRPGTADDLSAAFPLISEIHRVQRGSPSYTGLPEPDEQHVLSVWREMLPESDVVFSVAERQGRLLGYVLLHDEPASLLRSPDGLHLAMMATQPDLRGQGIGVALTHHALREARSRGRRVVDLDWRITNLESSRFWPARGFRPAFHRLHRVLRSG